MCMFRQGASHDVIKEDIEDENETNPQEQSFCNPSISNKPSVTIDLRVLVPCRYICLKNDQTLYWNELEKFSEFDKIEHLYVHSKSNYKVGTYLDTYIKFKTKHAESFKNDENFRENIWNRLQIKETYPK